MEVFFLMDEVLIVITILELWASFLSSNF